MSILFLVRHGQASFMSENYDQLSPLGERQARILGQHWVALGKKFDRVYVGPLRRHQQTQGALASVYHTEGLPFPEPEPLPELDEHQGAAIMAYLLPELVKRDPAIMPTIGTSGPTTVDSYKSYFREFERIMQLWVRDELEINQFQSWHTFRAQARLALKKIRAANQGGKTILAITSTGPIAVAMGDALDLDDEQTLDLSWSVRNASYAEFKFSGERFSLTTFNSASHFHQAELLTYV